MGKPVLLTTIFLALLVSPAATATWHVDDSVSASGIGDSWQTALKTIQEGINASSDGDTVIVAEGTYFENIRFNGKNINLTSTDPLNPAVVANTVIDGNQSGSVVTLSGPGEACVLAGFTIQNGWVERGEGAGVCAGSWQTQGYRAIENNIMTANKCPQSFHCTIGSPLGKLSALVEETVIMYTGVPVRTSRGRGFYAK